MTDLLFRTEDLASEEIQDLFVETEIDRRVVDVLKGRQPVVLVGSRGVGKSFLLKVAAEEIKDSFEIDRVLPVYLSLVKSSLLATNDSQKLQAWILARISSAIIRAAKKFGLLDKPSTALATLAGGKSTASITTTRIEELAEALEQGWREEGDDFDLSIVPSVEELKEAIADVCEDVRISRIVVLVDEAAHILVPEQQRTFFTLFRDLRSPKLTMNAAVYPGVTHYGDVFQPVHDAEFITLDRDIWSADYVANMKAMVEGQAEPKLLKILRERGENFTLLAYASSGNPRLLLKSISRAPGLTSAEINSVIREFYRDQVWSEHSQLASVYLGHRELVDWGRKFIENSVIPILKVRNDVSLGSNTKTALCLWVHRDAPERAVKAFRILQYSGVLKEYGLGIKGARSEVGTRYAINVGCILAAESVPTQNGLAIVKASEARRFVEFGATHEAFESLHFIPASHEQTSVTDALRRRLSTSVWELDLTDWQKSKLGELGLTKVRDVLTATDGKLQEAYYVGPARSRKMKNAAEASVMEFLSG